MKEMASRSHEIQRYNLTRGLIAAIVAEKQLGYVYTFPDKRTYLPVENSERFIESAWEGYEGKVGIYVHTPYCTPKPPPDGTIAQLNELGVKTEGRDHLCGYCNLFTTVATNSPQGYTDDVVSEIELYNKLFNGRKMDVSSVYFGGGTPTILATEDIHKMYSALEFMIGVFSDDIERTIETAPDLVDKDKLNELKKIGFNRVSVGVQTFDEGVLHYAGRKYDPVLGYQAVQSALEVGFENVNLDIIIGLPTSTRDVFMKDIEYARRLSPHTVTLYQDMVRPVTRFGKMEAIDILPRPSQEDIYAWTEQADVFLSEDGYERQSLTAWGKNGGGYQQGENIYKSIPVLGIGPGARSHAPHGHYSTEYTVSTRLTNYLISRWRNKVQRGEFPDVHGIEITSELKIRERVALGLLSTEGTKASDLQDFFSVELQALNDAGMVELNGENWRYTELGKKYSGALATLFFGEEIEERLKNYVHR